LKSGEHSWSRIFSSGGLLSWQAANDSRRVLGNCPIEVLGSTEASGVAWREQSTEENAEWTVLPNVSIRADQDSFLEVASPYSGIPGWLTMGDHVLIKSDTSFELLGRGDHIAKIEDKRVSLSAIEHQLIKTPWIEDAAAVALSKSNRQFVGAVLQLTENGKAELIRLGKRRFANMLKSLLDAVEPVAVPKRFRYVDVMPVNSQGKKETAALKQLLEQ
jgi:acyl-coenzyme A synthetase/AMP-(fatty) acid ligase